MLPLKAEGDLSLRQAPSAPGGLATMGNPTAELSISPKCLLQSSTSHREGDGAWAHGWQTLRTPCRCQRWMCRAGLRHRSFLLF